MVLSTSTRWPAMIVVASKGKFGEPGIPPKPLVSTLPRSTLYCAPLTFAVKTAPTLVVSMPLPIPSWVVIVNELAGFPLTEVMMLSSSAPFWFSIPSTSEGKQCTVCFRRPLDFYDLIQCAVDVCNAIAELRRTVGGKCELRSTLSQIHNEIVP